MGDYQMKVTGVTIVSLVMKNDCKELYLLFLKKRESSS